MPILGSSGSQSGRLPGVVSGVSAVAGDGQAVVSFTEPVYKGKGTVSYTVTSSPGGITATGSSSPITITGLSNGTSYTFAVTASSSGVGAAASSASGSVTPVVPAYVLSQTFNASGTYTVPAGKTKMAVVGVGSGGGGGGGSDAAYFIAGAGGGGGAGFSVREISVTPSATYSITIGAAGNGGTGGAFTGGANAAGDGNAAGTTNFGNIISATGGAAGKGGNTANYGGGGGSSYSGTDNQPALAYFPAPSTTQIYAVGGYGSGGQILVYVK